jgi:D-glycero-alpha-D-manno-heptose 1-phosphate guanylyltransferase
MEDLANTAAIILAGGMGTRLRSRVSDRPKVLASIRRRPFLAYLLDQLSDAGVREVVLCTGYMGAQVRTTFGDGYGNLHLVYSQELSPLGTGGAVRAALPLTQSDPVLVLNGDSFCQVDLPAMWARHHALGAEATLLLVHVPDSGRYGGVKTNPDGRLAAFAEKNDDGGPGWINGGMYLISRRLLETIPADGAVSLEREVFPAWIGRATYGYPSEGPFLDIGTPETYAAADSFFAQDMKR